MIYQSIPYNSILSKSKFLKKNSGSSGSWKASYGPGSKLKARFRLMLLGLGFRVQGEGCDRFLRHHKRRIIVVTCGREAGLLDRSLVSQLGMTSVAVEQVTAVVMETHEQVSALDNGWSCCT